MKKKHSTTYVASGRGLYELVSKWHLGDVYSGMPEASHADRFVMHGSTFVVN